jgi:hypothetical protein
MIIGVENKDREMDSIGFIIANQEPDVVGRTVSTYSVATRSVLSLAGGFSGSASEGIP